ncbi:inner membrane protein import complex subunit Tim54-domain-containing protein [Multifurca ochricompacta]|uniref:Mitochondrial import inner membrane translocase subunit TIM54 n=1 Tax=Multifurca ochricompacta TaxID=376703 RepID=A0AAD4MAB9_9AGAM|nr:inner membrane protein import complex subunit Tim54-domain-containing protein [Multifurca ochricompacta]
MNLNNLSSPPPKKSGFRTALEFTGIPPSWFDKRPRLPSRNWLIFLSVTQSLIAYYAYDRRQSQNIRQDYVDRVKHLAEESLHSLDFPRTVTVCSAKWPGDDDWDRCPCSLVPIQPIFVAAAIDYTVIAGKRHGDLATHVANDIKTARRAALGLDPPPLPLLLVSKGTPEVRRRRTLDGGTVIIGRAAFKEYMTGVRRGWTESLQRVDEDERLSKELEGDGHFDDPEPSSDLLSDFADGEPLPTPSRLPPSRPPGIFSPFATIRTPPPLSSLPTHDSDADVPTPTHIPLQPPLLPVPFVNLVGIKLVPLMIWDFFNERHKVRAGAEAAYKLISCVKRPFERTDLDFDLSAEGYYKRSTAAIPADVQRAREGYYKALPEKLATARALARGEREPTKLESEAPPPTEVELRAERLKKEMRWRADERGWELVRPEMPVEWDKLWEDALEVFVDPPAVRWDNQSA